jgi:DNA-binding LacI/PurR family transcriptional regulator
MSFLRKRHEQLVDHLRDAIRDGRVTEPLPNTRDWASQLGVSCTTLYAALRVLVRERLVVIRPRQGVRLNARPPARRVAGLTRTVRILYRGADYPEFFFYSSWCGLLARRLQPHGIQLTVENCSDAQLRALCSKKEDRSSPLRELFILRSLSERYQRLFHRSGRPSLVLGYPAPGVPLPCVTVDTRGAIRHAAHGLLRRGFSNLHLLIGSVRSHAVKLQADAFEAACAEWPHPPVQRESLLVPLDPPSQIAMLRRFAGRIRGRHGILVLSPVSAGGVMTTLLAHGIGVPDPVEVVVIDSSFTSVVVWPPPIRYEFSIETFVKALTRAAMHFFETGVVPPGARTIPLDVVKS